VSHTREEIETAVLEQIRDQLGMEAGTPISLEADFFHDLGGDALDYAEIGMELEEKLEIDIPDTEQPTRIGAIIDKVVRCAQEPVAAPQQGSGE